MLGADGPELRIELTDELCASTRAAQQRLMVAPFFRALSTGELPLESYVGHLRALLALYGVIAQALPCGPEGRVRSVWIAGLPRLPLVDRDLQFFEPRTVADLQEAVAVVLALVDEMRLESLQEPLSLLGWLHVLEDTLMASLFPRPLVARALKLLGDEGTACLEPGGGEEYSAMQSPVAQRMNTLQLAPHERRTVLAAANGLMARLETLFATLYPFRPQSRTFLVASINAEAGRHPVPADGREFQAAVRAGDLCWHRFPYFDARYGTRGKRFARSDAAWLATLCAYPAAQVLQQVRWLGRLLACRGMPTLLLEVQLEILADELAAAVPERRADYERLLPAAADLREARRRVLCDERATALSQTFDEAVGSAWSTRFPSTGVLLAAAVADEAAGIEQAVSSLHPWLSDEARFPAAWVAAVDITLAQARQWVRQPRGVADA